MSGGSDRTFSFEFFPPRTPEGADKLRATRAQLAQLAPEFFSVTFGAGGSTRDGTLDTVLDIRANGLRAAPHLSCIGSTRGQRARDARDTIARTASTISSRCAATLPSGSVDVGEFRYANELVAFIRATTGDWFHIDVAAYPEYHPQAQIAARRPRQLQAQGRCRRQLGDHAVFLQRRRATGDFVDEAAALGVDVPIVPGIMPIASFSELARFSDNCGAEIPRWIRRKLESFGDDSASIRAFGLDVVTDAVRAPARARRAGPALLHAEPGER